MSIRSSEADGVELVILPPTRDLGDGFTVRRALPSAHRHMVGPFIFFDQMGPAAFRGGGGLDVRSHPHIGLATVTYLLGRGDPASRQLGLGAAHPARRGELDDGRVPASSTRSARGRSGGLRAARCSGCKPGSRCRPGTKRPRPTSPTTRPIAIPVTEDGGVRLTLIAGASDGLVSPVKTFSDLVYADIVLQPGARYRPLSEHVERAVYVVEGEVEVDGQRGRFTAGELVVLKPDAEVVVLAIGDARLMLIGGEPLPEQRHIYWNFVSSRAERIEQAKADWRAGGFARVPDDAEFIPLPPDPKPVAYP